MGVYDRFTGAFKSGFAPFDKEGPAIEVQPFAPGEVTPEGGILRAITAIAGARRARANYEALQRDKQASRYRDVLETKLLEHKLAAPDYENDRITEAGRHNRVMEDIARDRVSRYGTRAAGGAGTTRPPSAAATDIALKQLDKEAADWAEERLTEPRIAPGGKRQASIAETAQLLVRQLRHADPKKRLEAQRALGVSPATEPSAEAEDTPEGKVYRTIPVKDKNGLPVYDAAQVNKAVEGWLNSRRSALLGQWKQQNASRVSAYRSVAQSLGFGGLPEYDEASDPLMDAADELFGGQ